MFNRAGEFKPLPGLGEPPGSSAATLFVVDSAVMREDISDVGEDSGGDKSSSRGEMGVAGPRQGSMFGAVNNSVCSKTGMTGRVLGGRTGVCVSIPLKIARGIHFTTHSLFLRILFGDLRRGLDPTHAAG